MDGGGRRSRLFQEGSRGDWFLLSLCGVVAPPVEYSTPMRNWILPFMLCVGCFPIGDLSWEGRYAKAAEELETAESDEGRFYALNDAAKAAVEVGELEDAGRYATELLELAGRYQDNWNYGNAVHDGHMVLGRIALRSGDVDGAKRELLLAGGTPGSPQLDSFGPNVSLAKDLLEAGETETVVQYFDLCRKFWELEDGDLKRWSVLAEAGEMPDFGPHLVY
jgi:hypothetical protein